ncbi:MAG: hypothetical protein EOO36_11605 [Cytophagaceae bacterium]|nr:MAG: hypothetical protein EOO36_11605 [Cytophagaceae bacterium]
MKADEIIIRQDRVVYTLMILLAGMGLLWSFWQHQRHTEIPETTTQLQQPAAKTAPGKTIYVR